MRWLRPEFQSPDQTKAPEQLKIATEEAEPAAVAAKADKLPWPKALPEQVRAVAQALAHAKQPVTIAALSERFSGRGPWKRRLPQLVETLVSVGRARKVGDRVLGVG